MGVLRRRAAVLGLLASVLLVFLGLITTVGLTSTDETSADAAVDPLPPQVPRRDLPKVLDGRVLDSARVGNYIVVAGDFTSVRRSNGTVVGATGVFAYHIDSGELLDSFQPQLFRSGDVPTVLAVEAAGPDSVFLGGKFGAVDNYPHKRLTKITLSTGAVETGFAADFDGHVRDIVVKNGRLFVGGEFEHVNGVARGRLVEMNAATGVVDMGFDFPITGSTRLAGEPFGPKYLGITPQNILVIAHRSRFIGTSERRGLALIDLSTDSLLPWKTTFWGTGEQPIHTVDAEASPDGTYVVLVGDGGDYPFFGRDAAVAFSIDETSNAGAQPMWIARNFDSTYAVGISDDAVFVGGHFCWVESSLAPDPWPGDGEFTNNNSCFGQTPAGRFAPEVVNRDQIAALDPATGHALLWDPGSDGLEGVQSIEVIDRGILVGHDGTFLGRDGASRRAWNVGRHGFFDVTQPDGQNNPLFIDQPVVGTCNGLEPTLTGTTRDDTLIGTDGDDVILGGPGLDRIEGLGGHDTICGGPGNDVILGGIGNDKLFGNEAADTLIGGYGNDLLVGGYWKDRLVGGPGNDVLRGGPGADWLQGGSGSDVAYGAAGMDRLEGGSGNDQLFGQYGRDRVAGGPGADVVDGGVGRDRCGGGALGGPNNPGDTKRACERT